MLKKYIRKWGLLLIAMVLMAGVRVAFARTLHAPAEMHIMEGFLPPIWAIIWFVVAIPFWVVGFTKIRKLIQDKPESRLFLGLAGAFAFVLSALKIPSVTGSSSHPTGTGLGAIMFGPAVMSVLGAIILLFQALLLAHGGLTTLGANTVSMGIAGPLVAWWVWKGFKGKMSTGWVVFLAAGLANLVTYVVTATQLAVAYPDPVSGFIGSWAKFLGVFALTQIPLAISEGLLTVVIYNALRANASEELKTLGAEA